MLHVVVGNFLQGMVYFVQNYNLEQHQQIARIILFLTNKEVAHIQVNDYEIPFFHISHNLT